MTPDTTAYMIAGFCVIFGGILIYVLSLVLRARRINRQINLLEDED